MYPKSSNAVSNPRYPSVCEGVTSSWSHAVDKAITSTRFKFPTILDILGEAYVASVNSGESLVKLDPCGVSGWLWAIFAERLTSILYFWCPELQHNSRFFPLRVFHKFREKKHRPKKRTLKHISSSCFTRKKCRKKSPKLIRIERPCGVDHMVRQVLRSHSCWMVYHGSENNMASMIWGYPGTPIFMVKPP